VSSRNARGFDPGRGFFHTTEEVLAFDERNIAFFPGQPEPDSPGCRLAPRRTPGHDAAESVSEAVHGPQQPRIPSGVAQGAPERGHEPGQAGLGDERVRPQSIADLRLRERARTLRDEEFQELKSLRGEVDLLAATKQLPGLRVQRQVTKCQSHWAFRQKSRKTLGCL
jgi:hypothetical protein